MKKNLLFKNASKLLFWCFTMFILLVSGDGFGQVSLGASPYTQNFNSIGSGLPTGWTVRTGATSSALGTSVALTTATTSWSGTTAQFANFASGNSPSASGDAAGTQSGRTDRALGLRQSSSFGDGGGAYVLQLANTTGLTSFNLSFKIQSLDITAGSTRAATWTVSYGFGASPSSFTTATTTPTTVTTSASTFGSTSVTVNFGSALNNNAGPVWIRIAALSATSGGGIRPSTGLDDVSLTYSSGPTAPLAPTITGITPGNTQLSVAFTAGGDGGSAITNYKYSTDNGTTFTACSPAQTTSPIIITGLTNGSTYNVQIKAVNTIGDGAATASTAATPSTTPSAPTITSITQGNTQLSVAFTAGVTGGSAITNYKYSTDNGATFTAVSPTQTASPIIITGLTNGTPYDVQIKAVNANGDGAASATTQGTPVAPANTITTTPATYGPFCNSSANNISVAYSSSGTTGTFYAQISNAAGVFTDGVFTGATIIGSGSSPISATIPSAIAAGTGYKVRVINDIPNTYGTDNGTAFTISAPPSITSGTLANKSVSIGSPATFTVTATNAASYSWYEDNGSGFSITPIVTGSDYNVSTPGTLIVTPSVIGMNGYKYKVVVNGNSPCGTVTSNDAILTVTVPPLLYSFTSTAAATGVPANLTASLMTRGNDNGTASFLQSTQNSTGYTGASGPNNATVTIPASTATLNPATDAYFEFILTPNASYKVALNSLSFGSYATASGPTKYALRSNLDNYTTNIASGNLSNASSWSLLSNTGLTTQSLNGTAVVFRLYGYNGSGATGAANWRIDDLSASVTVVLDTNPYVIANPTLLTNFGSVNVGASSASSSFSLTGGNLSPANAPITITAPTNFEVSLNSSTGFGNSVNVNAVGGAISSTPIYVRFTPTSDGSKNGNVTFSGGTTIVNPTVTVSGTGILAAPTATAANPIAATTFTANWNVLAGASSYLLDVSTASDFLSASTSNIVSESFENSIALFPSPSGGVYKQNSSASGDRPATSPYYTVGTYGYGVNNDTAVLTSNVINTTGWGSPQLSFNLAAFSVGSTGNGLDGTDNVTVEISTDGVNYSTYMTVEGNGNAYWAYSASGVASTAYPTPATFSPSSGGSRTTDGYSTVTITNLPSSSNLKVRITLVNNSTSELWVIDNFTVSGKAPLYTQYPVSGTSQPISSLIANTNYYYRVSGVGANSYVSGYSNTVSLKTTCPVPTFDAVDPICSGGSLSALLTTSTNGITGTWSPALNNMATTTYTFTPDVGQCATSTTMQIVVDNNCSTILPVSCGVTYNNLNSYLYSSLVRYAEGYRWRVKNLTTNEIQTADTPLRQFRVIMLSNFAYNTDYEVEVAVKLAGVWGAYSSTCTFSTGEPTTQMVNCAATPVSMTTQNTCNIVQFAKGYRFELTNGEDVTTFDNTVRQFSLSQVTGIMPGTTYSVRVAVQNTDSFYMAYGPTCTITSPGMAPAATTKFARTSGEVVSSDFNVVSFPNPFANSFAVNVSSISQEKVQIKVYDMVGRLVEQRNANVSELESTQIGNNYQSGIYNVIVSQGENVKTLRVIKR